MVVQTADEIPAEVVQICIDDGGNPSPLVVVSKNLTVPYDGDNLGGLRINDIAKEHVISPSSDATVYNPEIAPLFRLQCSFMAAWSGAAYRDMQAGAARAL
jgi:hypothetical protein